MVTFALFLAAFTEPSPLPADPVFECRTSQRALLPLPDQSITVAIGGDAFSLRPEDFAPLTRPRIVTRSPSRLDLLAGVEGFDAEFEAELVQVDESWRIEWRIIEVTGLRGERTVQVAGEGRCTMAGART